MKLASRGLVPLLGLVLLLGACPRRIGFGLSPLEEADERVTGGKKGARDQALAGFAAYLLRSDADAAAARFEKAGDDLWALYGRSELARRSLDTRERVRTALRICELNPKHPLCAVAARIALSATGESPGVDALIEAAAAKALGAGAEGSAAFSLRLAAAAARRNRGDFAGAHAMAAEAGAVSAMRLFGPYSRYHYLEWERPFAPEQGDLSGGGTGALGTIIPREALSPYGHYALHAENATADIYYWVADVEVRAEGAYQVRATGKETFKVFVDGTAVLERRDFAAFLPQEAVAQVFLAAGRHRLTVKTARDTGEGDLSLALSRADGRPADLGFAPPSTALGLTGGGTSPGGEARGAYPTAESLASALDPEVGSALAAFVAARDAMERDDQGAKALVARLVALQGEKNPSAPVRVLQAEMALADRSLPSRIAKGRAGRDLEEALELDPREASALRGLSIYARTEGRFEEAAQWLVRAREASPGSWRILLTEMRLAQARGVDSLANEAAVRALALEPGLCEAAEMRYDLARRDDAVALAEVLLKDLAGCPAHDRRLAADLRRRGELESARDVYDRLAAEAPLDPSPLLESAQVALALGKPLEAAAVFEKLERAWPRNPLFHVRRADALEQAGDTKGARTEREAALALDGSDLKLRRSLAIEDGRELLDDMRQDGEAHLARYRAASPPESSAGVYVLDSDALEAYSDGSFTERTHVLAKVVDQRGVALLSEVQLPEGAEILTLRTIKKDGRVLEPESIIGVDGVSLPGVEVGDFVEYEYLAATAARGAASPGFAAPKFYYRISDAQLFHSIYQARAPAGTGMEVDAHGMKAPRPQRKGEVEEVLIERERMPPFVREPDGPAKEEVLPFVQVGAGSGAEEMLASIGDYLIDRAKPTAEIASFARSATRGLIGLEAVHALYDKVMQEIKGSESTLSTAAAATLAQGRGSRLMLLKASLAAVDIPSRIVLVRPFNADPAPYRFPSNETYSYVALQVQPMGGGSMLLTPGIRFAPFAKLAPLAEAQEAAVLPELGEKVRFFQTPGDRGPDLKSVELKLALSSDGDLSGSGEEICRGLTAAAMKNALEQLDQEKIRQVIESAVARTFENAILEDLAIDDEDEPGAPVTVRYRFTARGYARPERNKLVVANGVFQANLGRRFLSLFERTTPLLISNPEQMELVAEVALPPGMALAGPPQTDRIESPFGYWERTEQKLPGKTILRERLTLPLQRVLPEQYQGFGDFVAAVDKGQAREWVFENSAPED